MVNEETASGDKGVNIGTTVTVEYVDSGKTAVFTIVGSQEADPKLKRVSDESPFGKALMGQHVGDTVTIEAPTKTFECMIVDISQ